MGPNTGRSLHVTSRALGFVSLAWACLAVGSGTDMELLLAFKATFDNGDTALSGWNATADACSWPGVTCNGGSVQILDMYNLRLRGSIPATFWNLPDTVVIVHLQHNALYGTLSFSWKFPPSLEQLDLSQNQLFGSIPKLTLHDNLTYLGLVSNKLEGTLPSMSSGASILTVGVKPGNQLLCVEDKVPKVPSYAFWNDSTYELVALERASLPPCTSEPAAASQADKDVLMGFKASFTNGGAVLPGWLEATNPCASWAGVGCDEGGNVTSIRLKGVFDDIKYDYLSDKLNGTIPEGGWILPKTLEELVLPANNITGHLPSPALPSGLVTLDLSENSLTGPIPDGWILPANLQNLFLYSNQLSGTWPSNLQLPESLNTFWLYLNRLHGQLPDGVVLPKSMVSFYLSSNQFSGTVPLWNLTQPMTDGATLTLDSNNLAGSLPYWQNADKLSLAITTAFSQANTTTFCGTVPSSPIYITWETQDRIPLLPACGLSTQLLNFKASFANGDTVLGTWNTSTFDWGGGWLGVKANATTYNISAIDLSGQGLNGTLPADGWDLPSIQYLGLARNSLHGDLPSRLSLPDTMQQLDLSNNLLDGTLGQMTKWHLPSDVQLQLQLQNNSFSGSLPSWGKPVTDIVIQPGNPDLCGEVPSNPKYYNMESGGTLTQASLAPCTPSSGDSAGTEQAQQAGSGHSHTAVIVGVVVGVTAALVLGITGLWVWRRRRRKYRASGSAIRSKPYSRQPGANSGEAPEAGNGVHTPMVMVGPLAAKDALNPSDALVASYEMADTFASSSSTSNRSLQTNSLGSGLTSSSRPSQPNYGVDVKKFIIYNKDLQMVAKVGQGSFGSVYSAKWHHETPVAVKLLYDPANLAHAAVGAAGPALSLSNPVFQDLQKEAGMLASLRHPNIVSFYGVCPSPPALVTEYCDRGSLYDVLRIARASPEKAAELTFTRRLAMALDAAKGMVYLHSHEPPILHRDLKSPNLCVTANWEVKVCDFNLSKFIEAQQAAGSTPSTTATNARWLAPEILQCQGATFATDVYAFGIVLWELLAWAVPWANTSQFQIVKEVSEGGRPPIPPREALPGDGASFPGIDGYITLMTRCWHALPDERPTFAEIVRELRALLTSAT